MDPTSASSPAPPDAGVYQAAMARCTNDQQRLEGAAALRLIEVAASAGAAAEGGARRPLPPDATISIRI